MLLDEWEIWHTYSTFFVDSVPTVDIAAQNMVRFGLVECAVTKDGNFYYRSGYGVESGRAHVKLSADQMHAAITIEPQVEGFVLDAVFQASYLRFSEMRHFGQQEDVLPPYVRGFVGECQLVSQEREVLVYPIIKLHATGTVMVEMRVLSPAHQIGLDEFIESHVNVYKCRFDEVWGPPGLALLAQRAYLYREDRWPVYSRLELLLLHRRYAAYVGTHTETPETGDFEFELTPLWVRSVDPGNDGREARSAHQVQQAEEGLSFSDLAHTVIEATGVAVSGLREGIHLLLRGPKTSLERGDYWTARPHVHLMRHRGQMETSEENEKEFGESYSWIMARLARRDHQSAKRYLPSDSRPFEDFAAYVALQGSLWVWSALGLRQSEPWELPRGSHLVYENQPKVELLEHGYILHRRLAASVTKIGSPDAALRAQQDLIELKLKMTQSSVYGETRDLLVRSWEEMGVPQLQELVADALTVRHAQETAAEQRITVRWEMVLAIAFGILAVPSVATEVIHPMWEWLQIRKPSDPNAAKLFFVGVALILVMAGLAFSYTLLVRKRVRR